ncbi:hypothetical protein HY634_02020 [Candidatus Uhrbacteria bacterium]|nr:hypothetical protein [Candidatus Uhrbacteria bacterium]
MAHSIEPEFVQQFIDAMLAACPPGQRAVAENLRALFEAGYPPRLEDPKDTNVGVRMEIEERPDNLVALCAVDRIHPESNDLIRVLQWRYDLAVDHDERWQLLVRLGLLYRKLGSVEGLQNTTDALAFLREET